MKREEDRDRRRHARIRVKWPITVMTINGTIEGETRNITPAGLFIQCGESLSQNEVFTIHLRPPGRDVIQVKGKVIWSDLDGNDGKSTDCGMGFCFMALTEGHRRLLNDLIG